MADYPDWTDLVHIVGTDIMVAIDLQAAYVQMPVDIQAQYITLAIDITAQTIENITIDIEAQSVGVCLKSDWEVIQGNRKSWSITSDNTPANTYSETTYDVPTGKTLYLTQAGCWMKGTNATDRDKNQMTALRVDTMYAGGNGGCQLLLNTPLKKTEGETAYFRVYNHSDHYADLAATFEGYEI